MRLIPTIHSESEFRGTARSCGRDYGESHAEAIEAFLAMEVPPDRRRLAYARRCWKRLSDWEPSIIEFVRGMSEGSRRPMEEMVLLLSHEEIVHTKNCTGFGATNRGTGMVQRLSARIGTGRRACTPGRACAPADRYTPATLTCYPGLWQLRGSTNMVCH